MDGSARTERAVLHPRPAFRPARAPRVGNAHHRDRDLPVNRPERPRSPPLPHLGRSALAPRPYDSHGPERIADDRRPNVVIRSFRRLWLREAHDEDERKPVMSYGGTYLHLDGWKSGQLEGDLYTLLHAQATIHSRVDVLRHRVQVALDIAAAVVIAEPRVPAQHLGHERMQARGHDPSARRDHTGELAKRDVEI